VGLFARNFLAILVLVAEILFLARVVVSWVDPAGRNAASRQVIALTEPVLAPIRRALPSTGMLDLSPLIVLVVLSLMLGLFRGA
jgi:YggT family protein